MNPETVPYLECSTDPGTRSILEAAAGTGKTHNITRIVARLLMERSDALIENMVVVTFTRAAAAELKTRISSLLSHLSKTLEKGEKDELIDLAEKKGIAENDLKLRVRRALLNFDQASIGTIHSFAMHVLSGNSFGSRLKLNFTLNENTDPLFEEFCRDYFHTLLLKHSAPAERKLLTGYCGLSAGKIWEHVKERIHSPGIRVDVPGAPVYDDVETAIRSALAARGDIQRPRAGVIRAVCEEAFDSVSQKFRVLSEAENFLSQDGLILRLRDALDANEDFLKDLRKKYTFGLIDEFQDTSSAQFDIFRNLFLKNPDSTFIVVGDPRQAIYRFRNCDLTTYFTAVDEMEKAGGKKYPMNTNRRSGAKYIEALNAIFEPEGTFALAGMKMHEQHALPDSQVLWTADGRKVEHPIQVFRGKMGLESIFMRCAQDIAAMLRAGYLIPPEEDEDKKKLPARPLAPGDIAVLLNTKWIEGQRLRDALQKLNVPAVVLNEGNVFSSPEAQELVRFLEGVLNPDDNAARLRALMTPLGDLDFSQVQEEKATAAEFDKLQKLLEIWQKRSFGVMYAELCRKFRLYDRLGSPEGRIKLGKYNALADYLAEEAFAHKLTPSALFDVLRGHMESIKEEKNDFPAPPETSGSAVIINTVFGSKGLSYPVVFLPDLFMEESVKKTGPARCHVGDRETLLPPLPGAILNGLPEDARAMYVREKDEEIQEDLRKAYVAFTRARYFCRFYCGIAQKRDPEEGGEEDWPRNSAMDWLFRRNGKIPTAFSGLSELMEETFSPELHFPDAVEECDFPSPSGKIAPPVPVKLRRPDLLEIPGFHRGFLSFSALAGNSHGKDNAFASEKEDEGLLDTDEEMKEIQELRGGTAFGNAIHKVLENADFSLSREEFATSAEQTLNAYGFNDGKTKTLAGAILWNALNSPLPDGIGGSFCLSAIDPARKESEFEFLSAFDKDFDSSALFSMVRNYFTEKTGCGETAFPAANESFTKGFFNGSIDLFFEHDSRYYIVDWKTNQLKKGRNPYSPGALAAAMGENGYCLQYLIYTAALFKYLKLRLGIAPRDAETFYDERFGGVRYLFVRGMTPERPGDGVFADKPPYDICKKMEEDFIG